MKYKVHLINDKFYILIKPVKALVRSTTVYEVITRGDQFAFDLEAGTFTVLQRALVDSAATRDYEITETLESITKRHKAAKKAKARLAELQTSMEQIKLGLTE